MRAKLLAEFLGTFWLVLAARRAVLAAAFPELGIGFTGVSLAFGLSVLTAAYALGPISGGHFNPAVSLGLWAGGRFPAAYLPYWVAQVAARSSPRRFCISSRAAARGSTRRRALLRTASARSRPASTAWALRLSPRS